MRCNGCGFTVTVDMAPSTWDCNVCGKTLYFDSDDFLLRQYGAPGRDVRHGQVLMGRLAEQVIREHAIAFIEAPVGSGKSDAYGVPAILSVAQEEAYSLKNCSPAPMAVLQEQKRVRPRVVISTAKKNLQHQVAEKDLPFIRQRLGGTAVKIALIKGKGNYACRLKAETALEPKDKTAFDAWLNATPTEDLSDWPGRRPPFLFDVTADDCIGKSCSYASSGKCGYWRAKLMAKEANVLVANHHVVAYDLRFGPGVILGPYTTLILDEAHQAPSSFRAACSDVVSQGAHTRIVRQIDKAGILGGFDRAITDAWLKMFQPLKAVEGEIPKDPFGLLGNETQSILGEMSAEATKSASDWGWSSEVGWDMSSIKDSHARESLMAVLALKKTIERQSVALSRARDPDDNTVLYVATTEKGQKRLTMAPISVGKIIGPKIQLIPSTIVTSATMALSRRLPDGKKAYSFEDAKFQLGLNWGSYYDAQGSQCGPKKIHELVLDSPFNYEEQALLYTPRHIPLPAGPNDPERAKYILHLVNECSRLIRASKGNAFVLFTSKKDLQDVHAGLEEEGMAYPLIIQEEDAAVAFKEYMATPNSVLLGTKSFWEGVDVQGQKLQLVILTKLPFPAVTDPILQARTRQYVTEQIAQGVPAKVAQGNVFAKFQTPHMLTELRQGAGRLIRAKTDYGVLAILDCRVFTGNSKDLPAPDQRHYVGYGKQAIDAIGFTNCIPEFEIIERQLARMNLREEKRRAAAKKSSEAPGQVPSVSGTP